MPDDISTLEAVMPTTTIPRPQNAPPNWRCALCGDDHHLSSPRLRVINTFCEELGTQYVCDYHAYTAMSCATEYRADIDTLILHPVYLTGPDGVTRAYTNAEAEAITTVCGRCGSRHHNDVMHMPTDLLDDNGNVILAAPRIIGHAQPLCPNCIESWHTTCSSCGRPMVAQSNGNRICPSCARFRINRSKLKPTPKFFIARDEPDDGRYTGAEIEFEIVRNYNYDQFQPIVRKLLEPLPEGLMHAETDGSLQNGLEFVTMPLSNGYIKSNRGIFEKFYDDANEFIDTSATSLNAGLHVHMSRNVITPQQAMNMEKMITTKGLMSRYLLHITKRTTDRFNQWSKTDSDPTVLQALEQDKERCTSDRYRFLNWTKNTVECRGFAGDNTVTHFIAATQFIRSLHDWAKSPNFVPKCTEYRKFLATLDYPELQRMDAAFNANKSCKTPDKDLIAQLPGAFTHRGTIYCYAPEHVETARLAQKNGVMALSGASYNNASEERRLASHIDSSVLDHVQGTRYDLDPGLIPTWVFIGGDQHIPPITNDCQVMLAFLRCRVHPAGCRVFVGTYVFNMLLRANTMGYLTESEDDVVTATEETF